MYGRYYFQSGIIRIAFIRGNQILKDNNKDIDGRFLFGGAIILNETNKKYEYLKVRPGNMYSLFLFIVKIIFLTNRCIHTQLI